MHAILAGPHVRRGFNEFDEPGPAVNQKKLCGVINKKSTNVLCP